MTTFVCLGSGPSLTQADIDYCRGKANVIAINTTYKKALWANVLYAGDQIWWELNEGANDFSGRKISVEPTKLPRWPEIEVLRNAGRDGLELEPGGICTGGGSGYAAINLAVQLGASKIVLLGYDLQDGPNGEKHHHADHPGGRVVAYWRLLDSLPTLVKPLRDLGVKIVNSSRETALQAFPRLPLDLVL